MGYPSLQRALLVQELGEASSWPASRVSIGVRAVQTLLQARRGGPSSGHGQPCL